MLEENSFKVFGMFVRRRCVDFGMEKTKFPGDGAITG